ncbi:site-specific tyrosine recombinase [Bacillus phage vB_BanS-Thrax5]|nr:site-specific tyrosine recombinase [Bacillus phage vB_BanS-Thrax5]
MTAMTNINDNSLFDKDNLKKKFLGEIAESTAKSYKRIFEYAKPHEESLDKELRFFSLEEMETVLYGFKANTRNTVETYGRIISSYLNWCVEHGYTKNNVLKELKPTDFEKYLTNMEKYMTEKQLTRYEDRCVNAQDSVILRLSFIGVGGKQMSEIRNLKKSDIDWANGRIHLTNTLKEDDNGFPLKYTQRYLEVDERTLDILQEAIDQKEYEKKNGQMDENEHVGRFTNLIDNDYVIRASITNLKDGDNINKPADKFVIYRRLDVIKETLHIPTLTAKYIQRSGMVYYANELMKQVGDEMTLDELKVIADRYNMKSYHNLKGFLTIDNIRQTYQK